MRGRGCIGLSTRDGTSVFSAEWIFGTSVFYWLIALCFHGELYFI